MSREKPCPYRVIEYLGGGYAVGCMMGSVWYFVKGTYYAPKSQKAFGGIRMMKRRAPVFAGSFAMWGGIYSIT